MQIPISIYWSSNILNCPFCQFFCDEPSFWQKSEWSFVNNCSLCNKSAHWGVQCSLWTYTMEMKVNSMSAGVIIVPFCVAVLPFLPVQKFFFPPQTFWLRRLHKLFWHPKSYSLHLYVVEFTLLWKNHSNSY